MSDRRENDQSELLDRLYELEAISTAWIIGKIEMSDEEINAIGREIQALRIELNIQGY